MAMFVGITKRLIGKPKLFMGFLFNFWPPVLGPGIRVKRVSADMKQMEIGLKLHFYNKSGVGTHYGGSLYSMTDPFYMIMLIYQIGRDHVVWDKSATINFLKPGQGEVTAKFVLTNERISDIVKKAESGEAIIENFVVDVVDSSGSIVAHVDKELHIRKK